MKKNFGWISLAPKVGAAALILALATTALVGGTYARYVKSVSATDSARVAKFNYMTNLDDGQPFDLFASRDSNVRANDGGDNVIAPGTSGSFDLVLTNNGSEVATEFIVDCGLIVDGFADGDGGSYFPLKFDIDVADLCGRYASWSSGIYGETLKQVMENALFSAGFDPGPTEGAYIFPEDTDEITITINWAWPFEQYFDDSESADAGIDELDTFLGTQAAAGVFETIDVILDVDFIQVD